MVAAVGGMLVLLQERRALDLWPGTAMRADRLACDAVPAWRHSPVSSPASTASRPTSRTRSPPAKSSSARRASSRNSSRTRSTRARGASPSRSSSAGKRLIRVEDDGIGHGPRTTRCWPSSATRRARSRAPTTWRPSARSASAARRCRASRRCRISRCARGREATTSGTEVRVNGGTVASVREVGAAEGTVIEVADLFYNLPARRKFLKADHAESAQVSRLVTQMALAYPEVGFTLTSAGRRTLECPPVATFARAVLPAVRRPRRPRVRARGRASRCASSASSPRSPTTGRRAGRRTCSSTAAS